MSTYQPFFSRSGVKTCFRLGHATQIRTKLQSLCLPIVDEQPVVVLKTNKGSKLIQKALFVVCKTGETSTIFNLDNNGGVEVNL